MTEGLEALNRRYGGARFYLFHRERTWSDSEQQFIGWERKRGKLEELNRLLDGTRPEGADRLVAVGDPDQLVNVRLVITLDSDTQLPPGTARRMIETLAHPLNRPRFNAEGRIIAGYTIIQPRVSPTLPSTSASPFSRVLTGRFPEARVLSHDLIEGAHVRVGLASDIELYDEFPRGYESYLNRQHRWIRGDWQIADWIFPRVPLPGGGRGPNPLSGFDRWKIFDNLRRSLLPVTILGLLITSWLIAPQIGWIAALLVALQLLSQPLAQPFTLATTRRGWQGFSFSKVGHDLRRAVVDAALIPHQAGLARDAILRVGYRRLLSHRRLLQWTSAQAGLWAYGISGDWPMALVTIGEAREVNLVRQMLQAHTYWRRHGLMADLVILNEEAGGYEQPLRERLEGLIQSHSLVTGRDQPGGVFLRSNDPVTDPPAEVLYLRDEETGVFWTPTAAPIREETAYRVRHGAGYTVFEHNSQGIEQELTVFVPVDENGGDPVKLQRLRIRNDSARQRKLSLTY